MIPYDKQSGSRTETFYDCSTDHPPAPGVLQDDNIVECKVVMGSGTKKRRIDIIV